MVILPSGVQLASDVIAVVQSKGLQRQGVMVILPSGVQLASDVIAVVQSKGTLLKISIKVPGAVMDPK